ERQHHQTCLSRAQSSPRPATPATFRRTPQRPPPARSIVTYDSPFELTNRTSTARRPAHMPATARATPPPLPAFAPPPPSPSARPPPVPHRTQCSRSNAPPTLPPSGACGLAAPPAAPQSRALASP